MYVYIYLQLMDSLSLFFLAYTFIYHPVYYCLRLRIIKNHYSVLRIVEPQTQKARLASVKTSTPLEPRSARYATV